MVHFTISAISGIVRDEWTSFQARNEWTCAQWLFVQRKMLTHTHTHTSIELQTISGDTIFVSVRHISFHVTLQTIKNEANNNNNHVNTKSACHSETTTELPVENVTVFSFFLKILFQQRETFAGAPSNWLIPIFSTKVFDTKINDI